MLPVASPLLLLIFFLCVQSLLVWLVCVLECFFLDLSCMGLLCLLDFIDYFLSHVGEIFYYNIFKIFLIPYTCSFSSSGMPIFQMLVCLILFQRSLRLSSVLFILFSLFCSSADMSTILSSSSLIHSSPSDSLILIPSRVFLIQ